MSEAQRRYQAGDAGFQGAVFADDLSMAGAAAFGDIVARASLAREAGCDVLPVCNDRKAVETLLSAWRAAPEPVTLMRLARLHGRDAQPGSLADRPRWQGAVAAARSPGPSGKSAPASSASVTVNCSASPAVKRPVSLASG